MSVVEEYMFKKSHEIMNLEDEYIELIIVALQEERRLWIKEYTKSHNEYVDLQKQNTELKEENKKYKGAIQTYEVLLKSNAEENKQLKDRINKAIEICDEIYDFIKRNNSRLFYEIEDLLIKHDEILKGE